MIRIPEGDSWQDHAVPCPNCDKPVLNEREHFVNASEIDPAWWACDRADGADE